MSSAKRAYAEAFWEALKNSPTLRFQLIEIIEAKSLEELRKLWCFDHHEQLQRYIRGPLKHRLEREAGGEALRYLNLLMGDRGI